MAAILKYIYKAKENIDIYITDVENRVISLFMHY